MMNFLKNFFNDESVIIGLCEFETIKPKYSGKSFIEESNYFSMQKTFETNFINNVWLNGL